MSYDVWLEADLGGREPIRLERGGGWSYTSNVSCMWRLAMPETDGLAGMDGKTAGDVLPALRAGIARMVQDPTTYRAMEPENGWGKYDSQLLALIDLAAFFETAPMATVRVSR